MIRLLYSDPKNAAELYFALTGDECKPSDITILTITTPISKGRKNDLAFVVRGKVLIVGEHMSTPYANMPTRLLMYIGLLYDILAGRNIFRVGARLANPPGMACNPVAVPIFKVAN